MIDNENLLNEHGLQLYDSLIKSWVGSAITSEANARIAGDQVLEQGLSSLSESLETEIVNRISGDTAIMNTLDEYQDVTTAQIDALFDGKTRVVVVVDDEYAEYVTITKSSEYAEDGDEITLTAEVAVGSGYVFDGWYVNGTKVSGNLSYTLIFNENDVYEAKLVNQSATYDLTFFSNDISKGDVDIEYGGGIITQSVNVAEGIDFTFIPHAHPEQGYVLDTWTDGDINLVDGEEITLYDIRENHDFVATFKSEPVVTEVTYTFTNKSWADDRSAWSSNKDGAQFQNNRGVQITANATGAGATSNVRFSRVSKVTFTYSTNSSSGAGSIELDINGSSYSQNVTKTGGTSDRTLEFNINNETGRIDFTINCTTNSIYIKDITITYEETNQMES